MNQKKLKNREMGAMVQLYVLWSGSYWTGLSDVHEILVYSFICTNMTWIINKMQPIFCKVLCRKFSSNSFFLLAIQLSNAISDFCDNSLIRVIIYLYICKIRIINMTNTPNTFCYNHYNDISFVLFMSYREFEFYQNKTKIRRVCECLQL